MTFSLFELSRYLGQPIGLLRLSRGSLLELYTTADRPIEVGSDIYLPAATSQTSGGIALSRSPIRDSAERKKNALTIKMAVDAPCAAWWRPFPPSTPVGVTWLAMHYGDDEVNVEWTGRVVAPKFTDTTLELTCEQSKASARSRGLQLRWQRSCPLALYSQGAGMCNVDKTLHALPAVVTSIAGSVLEADEFASAPKPLIGGFIEYVRPDGEPEYRSIMAHTGNQVLLNYGSDTLDVGSALTAYPGCPHNWDGCVSFDNEENYGGAKYMPIKSPFDGNPV